MHDPLDFETKRAEEAAKQELLAASARAVEKNELRAILSKETGRTFVMRVIERAGVFRQTFDASATEATHKHAFNEGMRATGLWLLSEILESCPELWTTMLAERAKRLDARTAKR